MKTEKPRTKRQKIRGIQAALESHRRFDFDYIPFGTLSFRVGDFFYLQWGVEAFWWGGMRVGLWLLAPLFLKIAYGLRVVGRKNWKALRGKGAICVTNHISFMDTLFARAAI